MGFRGRLRTEAMNVDYSTYEAQEYEAPRHSFSIYCRSRLVGEYEIQRDVNM